MKKNFITTIITLFLFCSVTAKAQSDPGTANLKHQWTFDDGTAKDAVTTNPANGTLVGGGSIVNKALKLSSPGQYVSYSGSALALNTYSVISQEIWFASVAGANTGNTMLSYFAELYLCSAANKTLMNPAGGLRFAGLKSQAMYFNALLGKLGIRADFVRIGQHKSAPERFTRDSATEVTRADKVDLLQQHERQLVEGVSQGRRIGVPELRKRIAAGPYIASEALTAGFIDGYAFDDEVDERYMAIEQQVEMVLARQTPVAGDLRLVLAVRHSALHVERMGDQCVTIAKLTTLSSHLDTRQAVVESLVDMGERCAEMVRVSLAAFAGRDVEQARALPRSARPPEPYSPVSSGRSSYRRT